jgi:endonuclease/exonuclease/phosphatase family metal-dependent hydrolase
MDEQHHSGRGRTRCSQRVRLARLRARVRRRNLICRRALLVAALVDHALDRGAHRLLVWDEIDDETREGVALANAWLDLERQYRIDQWSQLERFLAYLPPGGTDDDVLDLPRPQARRALLAASRCGWLSPFGR